MSHRIEKALPPAFFGLFTVLWPGLGHVLFGQMGKGIILAIAPFFTVPLCGNAGINPLIGLLAVSVPALLDVVILAMRVRSGRPVGRWQVCLDPRSPVKSWYPGEYDPAPIPWGAIIGLVLGLLLITMGILRLLLAWNL